ncbi:sugar kinase [Mucilaginibacter phyllosphaerae]|uniref:2-dehydro-3-deoxygluconokinase n=1 Tax=Mucilaginibacter phyllosphaerae TaxID=1812349 RepID=A0A4Y8AJJ7_9SPHI|nr:sugar kinase [Mucilaginibacter phyllosphaerae]MBB3968322.1 2-dehydro-3-deoxygluconokinase [Mucilaginibacter phyllosphaerae]TEW68679.1 sugar kinase [Mucilaginibacter phyllosphaerae]GGG99727.1 2-dehydro-3-deoxygluconokinase [Mucilaginibacter phyllosphaerae]
MSNLSAQNFKSGTVLSFGELLLRICPDGGGEWLQNNTLPFYVGGAELNVATALALWNVPSGYFTALPSNGLCAQIVSYLDQKNIDTTAIHYHGNRLGLYFLTKGQDLKHDALIYDRANSAFADLKPRMIDWDKVLDGVSWFHFSAICPAISQQVADVCLEVLQAASAKGITISVDLNYRSKLWQYGKQPQDVMPHLVKYCDVIMGNIWAAEKMLGIAISGDIHESGQKSIYLKEALSSSERIMQQYQQCKAVANTFRFDERDDIDYYTCLYTDGKFYNSQEYNTQQKVDKVGTGDCFMAGLIYGFYNNTPAQQTLEFATAAAFQKLFITSDATTQTVEEITKAIKYE